MEIELSDAYRNSPLAREASELMSRCVQCGQCTFTCPTFRLLGDEWDGPRGRIYLMKKLVENRDPGGPDMSPGYSLQALAGRSLVENVRHHLDRCLGCRSCESSCPQGVRYGRLLDVGRELTEAAAPRPFRERLTRRLVRALVPYRYRFAPLLRLGQILKPALPAELRRRVPARRSAGIWPRRDHARKMLLWQGCVQPSVAPEINAAAARVLDRFGISVIPASAGCCGALTHHMSATEQTRASMRRTIDALWPEVEGGVEAIVLTASGCGMHFREYGEILRDEPGYAEKAERIAELTRDIAEVVAAEWQDESPLPPSDPPRRIVFQSSCSLQHGEKLNGVAEQLLKRAGFKLLRAAYPFMCCGAAGAYSLVQWQLSDSLRTRRLETLLSTRPAAIATANVGCLGHLAPVSPVPVYHWISLVDEALATAHAGGSHSA